MPPPSMTIVFHDTPPPYQTMTVWWSDWSWDGWNYINSGALVIVLVCIACCIAASLPIPERYYYDRAPLADEYAPPVAAKRGAREVEMRPGV